MARKFTSTLGAIVTVVGGVVYCVTVFMLAVSQYFVTTCKPEDICPSRSAMDANFATTIAGGVLGFAVVAWLLQRIGRK